MSAKRQEVPVVDIFAGPGGLGEGFSRYSLRRNPEPFKICLSAEMNPTAHATLRLRSFFRQFGKREIPEDYYRYIRNEISLDDLFEKHPAEAAAANNEAWCAELGKVSQKQIDRRVSAAIGKAKTWVLIGGPPCQAYSVMGRSRMAKSWRDDPEQKAADPRHFLYKEYLRILQEHRPSVFVMENVKGILSASLNGDRLFDRIIQDLRQPSAAMGMADNTIEYKLYSFSSLPNSWTNENQPVFDPRDFIIKSENYGIPQCRHRVVILGVRNDIDIQPGILRTQRQINIDDVISDLPELRSTISRGMDSPERWLNALRGKWASNVMRESITDQALLRSLHCHQKLLSEDLTPGLNFVKLDKSPTPSAHPGWYRDPRLAGVLNHTAKSHMKSDLLRYFFASIFAKEKHRSPVLFDFPERLLPKHKNVRAGVNRKAFGDRFRVQKKGAPSTTVVSHLAKDGHYFIHYDPLQCRALTVREAARLQTFPDNFFFTGPRTSQYTQVGNAVPPLLARQLAGIVYDLLHDSGLAR